MMVNSSFGVTRRHLIPADSRARRHPVPWVRQEAHMDRGEVQRLVDLAREISGLAFGLSIGPLPRGERSVREQLERLSDPDASIMVGVDPDQHLIAIVTGAYAQSRVNDHACRQALLAMQRTLAEGEMAAALRDGIVLLAEHAREPHVEHLGEPA